MRSEKKSKKIFYIPIAVVVLGALFGPFKTDAAITCMGSNGAVNYYPNLDSCPSGSTVFEGYVTGQSVNKPSPTDCDIHFWNLGDIFSTACLLRAAAGISEWVIWTPAKFLFSISGYAMDKSIVISINNFRDFASSPAVTTGWTLARDVVNIFLIFILLYIAIATILQISGYGARELLVTLIVVAFLINFSLVITRLIIDAANVLAVEFYRPFTSAGIGVADMFRNAFDAGSILKATSSSPPPNVNIYLVNLITYLAGGIILLIAAFIFLMFGILFLIRMVALLILMVFAPLAFAAHTLPSTRKHAHKWWDYLFSQAFFAPAALFLLWLSANVANSGFIQGALGIQRGQGFSDMLIAATGAGSDNWNVNWDNVLKFIIQFIIVAILLVASLIFAKQMGAIGADAAVSGGRKALKRVQGYAGRTTRKYATVAAGKTAEAALRTPLARIPLAGRGLARISGAEEARRKKEVAKYEKVYGNYTKAGLEALRHDVTLFGAKRQALQNILAREAAKEAAKKQKAERETKFEEAIKSGNLMDVMVATAKMQMAGGEEFKEAAREIRGAAETIRETKTPTKT